MATDRLDVTIRQGETLARSLTWLAANGLANSLAGYSAKMDFRGEPDGTLLAHLADGSGVTLGGLAGTVVFTVDGAVTAGWAPGRYFANLIVTPGGGNPVELLYVAVLVLPGVTA